MIRRYCGEGMTRNATPSFRKKTVHALHKGRYDAAGWEHLAAAPPDAEPGHFLETTGILATSHFHPLFTKMTLLQRQFFSPFSGGGSMHKRGVVYFPME